MCVHEGMPSEISFLLRLFGCHSCQYVSQYSCVKLAQLFTVQGDFSWTERHVPEGESISAKVSEQLRRLHSIPIPRPVCLPNRPQAEWDWPQVHCKHRPLKVVRAGKQRFPTKPWLAITWSAPLALTSLSQGSCTADSSVNGTGNPSPPPNETVPYGDPYYTWVLLIKRLRSSGLISFPP